MLYNVVLGFPGGSVAKNLPANAGDSGWIPRLRQSPEEGNSNPLQYCCLENPVDGRSLGGCSPWGREELDTTEPLHFHFSLSCIGEGNGNPLQCSCLGNPRDSGAWWAAFYRVAEFDMTERLHFHFSLSCIEEGNGNPLQCSCLENPRDSGAWWAAFYGVAQSRT